MRLDVFLFERGLARSRSEAKALITEGAVMVDGRFIAKPAFDVPADKEDTVLVHRAQRSFVSRGGTKLQAALTAFGISVLDRNALDIGASSGGFTDCLLQNGAGRVIALDTGHGQLAAQLRADPRVYVIENYNARYLEAQDLPYSPDLAVMDVSFISATCILPAVAKVLTDKADFICLVKPQFEVGRERVGKGGIVKDKEARQGALHKVVLFAATYGLIARAAIESPIAGGDGNIEYLVHFEKKP